MMTVTIPPKTNEDVDAHKNIPFLSTGSTTAVQREDRGLWIQRTVVGHGTEDHTGRSYKLQVMKTRCIITGTET